MVLAYLLIFLPAFALSSKDSVAIVPAEDLKVCEYFDARIIRLGEIVNEELRPGMTTYHNFCSTFVFCRCGCPFGSIHYIGRIETL